MPGKQWDTGSRPMCAVCSNSKSNEELDVTIGERCHETQDRPKLDSCLQPRLSAPGSGGLRHARHHCPSTVSQRHARSHSHAFTCRISHTNSHLDPTPTSTPAPSATPTSTHTAASTPTATALPGCEVLFKSLNGYFGNPNLAILVPWDAAQFAASDYSLAGITESAVTCEFKGSYLQCAVESTVLGTPYPVTFWGGPLALCQGTLQFAYLPTSTPQPTDVPPTSEPEPTDISPTISPSQTPIPTQPPFVTPTDEG